MRSSFQLPVNVKCFAFCIVGLQLLLICIFVYYLNSAHSTAPNAHPLLHHESVDQYIDKIRERVAPADPGKRGSVDHEINDNAPTVHYEYIEMVNYRAHLSTDPNVVRFGEINGQTLSGLMVQLELKTEDHLGELRLLCDALSECIGFSLHPNLGAILCNASSFPLQYVRNWRFFVKNDPLSARYEADEFVNERIGFRQEVISSAEVPSLSALGLAFKVPLLRRQFMSFEWNMGRTNNQLYSLEAMLQYVALYQRTLILPFASHRNHELAMTANATTSVWDMLKLSEFADYIFEHELAALTVPDIYDFVVTENEDIDFEAKTFDVAMSEDDRKWRRYFEETESAPDHIRNEPNWNLLSLLEYRRFTNNERWTLR